MPTLTSTLEKEVKARPLDAQLRGDYATVLDATNAFDEREQRRDVARVVLAVSVHHHQEFAAGLAQAGEI